MHGEYSWSSLGGRTYRAAYIYLDLGYMEFLWLVFGIFIVSSRGALRL